ncbi:MAG: methyltransferase, partial [Psychroserpens sp.]|nr:methyltransferase [Psychroserpens sp.]
GAWTDLHPTTESVLDIGTGTGILALMIAQRSQAELIDGIEIDDSAYEQCVDNFEHSPWGDRLFCYHASLEEFVNEIDDHYDLIISNPPFYPDYSKSGNEARDLARFQDAMPFDHLIESARQLLTPTGRLVVIIPFSEESRFLNLSRAQDLFARKILRVKGAPNTEFKRSLIDLSFQKTDPIINDLIIETSRHEYTDDYIALTKDFYLKM